MTMQTGQQAPADTGAGAPPPDPDAAKWEELAKEVGVETSAEPEPASEPAAEPSEPAEPAPQAKPTELDNLKTALREAREAHKAEQARTDAILAALREAKDRRGQPEQAKKESEQQALPDVQADPIGHFQGRIAQLEQMLVQSQQGGQQQTQQIAAHLQEQAMWSTVERSEVEIRDPKSAGHKADYDEACQHLEGGRVRQLDAMYPSDSPQVQQMARQQGFQDANQFKLALLNQDRRAVATHALQMGMSPAQLYYELAVRAGYQPKTNGQAAPNGAAERASQIIAAAKKGTKAAVTLSGGGSSRKGANDMSLSDLADLYPDDPEEADRIFNDMKRRGLLG